MLAGEPAASVHPTHSSRQDHKQPRLSQGSQPNLQRNLAALDRALRVAASRWLQQLAQPAGTLGLTPPAAPGVTPTPESLLGQLHLLQQLPLLATLLQALGPEAQAAQEEDPCAGTSPRR